MISECQAANPTTCRFHGNPTISSLQAQADQAAMTGNVSDYIALRGQIDAAQDALESQPTEKLTTTKSAPVNPAVTKRTPRKTAERKMIAGANAALKQIADWQEMEADARPYPAGEKAKPYPIKEEVQMVKRGLQKEVAAGFAAAIKKHPNKKLTTEPEAIEEVAYTLFESFYGKNKPSVGLFHRTPYFEDLAKTILEAAIDTK